MKQSAIEPSAGPPTARVANAWQSWFWGAILVVLTAIVYWPTLGSGFVSDDTFYVQHNLALRSLPGLSDIWFKLETLEQYYPLTLSALWAQYQLWGLDPAGYHAVNFLLHGLAAVLVWRLLARLAVPGAWLAAALFAVHPVQVDTIAMIHELKNLLSCVLALGSLLAYLRFSPAEPPPSSDTERISAGGRWMWYALALALYVAALLSKTVASSVPAVLLVIYWWKRGRLSWRDVAPLVPFFAIGLLLSLLTVMKEYHSLGAGDPEWDLSPLERVLIAGRALWFYAGKLAWPYPLLCVYPRWVIDPSQSWQYLYPAAALAVMVVLWLARKQIGRGPLAAVFIFAGVLVPGLGFVNLYMFRITFVADHIEYHAAIALLALGAAVAVSVASRLPREVQRAAPLAAAMLIAPLALMARESTQIWKDNDTLMLDLAERSPQSSVAHRHVASYWFKRGQFSEALAHYRKTIASREQFARHNPRLKEPLDDVAAYHVDIALVQRALGNVAEEERSLRQAIAIREKLVAEDPAKASFQDGLAWCFADLAYTQRHSGRIEEAEASYAKVIQIRKRLVDEHPTLASYQNSLAAAYADLGELHRAMGRTADSEADFQLGIELRARLVAEHPLIAEYQAALAASYEDLAVSQQAAGRTADALASRRKAIDVREALAQNAPSLLVEKRLGRLEVKESLTADPALEERYQADFATGYVDLGNLQRALRQSEAAEQSFRRALKLREQLHRDHPLSGQYSDGLAWCYVDLGLVQHDTGRLAEAEASCRKALEIRRQLAASDATPRYQNNVAASLVDLGILLFEQRQIEPAQAAFRQAITIREELVRAHPDVADFQDGLGWCFEDLGATQLAAGQPREAIAVYADAVQTREKLVFEHTNVPAYRFNLGRSYANLGDAQRALNSLAEAETSYRSAVDIREVLSQENPAILDYQEQTAASYRELVKLLRLQDRMGDASAALAKTVAIDESLLATNPNHAIWRANLSADLAAYGEALAQEGNWVDSAQACSRAQLAGDLSWQNTGLLALVQLASGNDSGYRAACADLVKRLPDSAAGEARLSALFILVIGEDALADMSPVAALARQAAAEGENPLAEIAVGAAEYRTGNVQGAIPIVTKALSQLAFAPPTEQQGAVLVGRLTGQLILALAHQQSGGDALRGRLARLQSAIEQAESFASPGTFAFTPWTAGCAAQIGSRELMRLSESKDAIKPGSP